MKVLGWTAAVCLISMGCNEPIDQPPSGVIGKSEFVDILTEIQLLEAGAKKRLRREDDEQAIYRGQYLAIFEAHQIDEAQFKASYTWWFDHPELLTSVYDDVIEQLNTWERRWGEMELQEAERKRSRK